MEQANIIRRTYNSWLSEAILMNKSILPHARYTPQPSTCIETMMVVVREGRVVVTPEQNRNDDGGGGDTRTK